MSVVTSNEAQLILARGTALMMRSNAETVAVPLSGEQPAALEQTSAAALRQKLAWFSPPVRAAVVLVAGAGDAVRGGPYAHQPTGVPIYAGSTGVQFVGDLGGHSSRSGIARAGAGEQRHQVDRATRTGATSSQRAAATRRGGGRDGSGHRTAGRSGGVSHGGAGRDWSAPAEGTPHLPAAAPVIAAGPSTEAAPAPPTPPQASLNPIFGALP